MNHGLDTDTQIFFYEQDFYVLSNFSAFMVEIDGLWFPTAEHAYHWFKFDDPLKKEAIRKATSAHVAYKLAQRWKEYQHIGWHLEKVSVMRKILWAKVHQHIYVMHKLCSTDDRELIENSWRDDYWGWGPNKDGMNMLGKLWMEIRAELRNRQITQKTGD